MNGKPYSILYVDAFAGTGYRQLKQVQDRKKPLFPEIEEVEVSGFLSGSAKIALQIDPKFDRYVFIEKSKTKVLELNKLKIDFPDETVDVVCAEANNELQLLCATINWSTHRAVLFLDPFAMAVSWETMKAIANTKAIDTWILFPIMAVNRLLKKNGQIPDSWRLKLDKIFGDNSWYNEFFQKSETPLLSGDELKRKVNIEKIGSYYNKRLSLIFPAVAPNPLMLKNSHHAPLFLLCFAAANPSRNANQLAIKIAAHILSQPPKGCSQKSFLE
jgi:three-Cys-motif partner protein